METLYHNGLIITGNHDQDLSTPCTCLLVKGDIISAVGAEDEPSIQRRLHDEKTKKVDLNRRIVFPGFVDG